MSLFPFEINKQNPFNNSSTSISLLIKKSFFKSIHSSLNSITCSYLGASLSTCIDLNVQMLKSSFFARRTPDERPNISMCTFNATIQSTVKS